MRYRLKEPFPYRRRDRPAPREPYTVPTHGEWLMGRLFDGLLTPSVLSAWADEAASYNRMTADFVQAHPPFRLRRPEDNSYQPAPHVSAD